MRAFATSAAAVLVFVVDAEERLLLLHHPQKHPDGWQVISGAVEAEETLLAAALRETREEIGPAARVRPLGTVHAYTYRYDDAIQYMIDVCYLMAYEGGPVEPGDDMAGAEFRWWTLEELADESIQIVVPTDQKWLMGRAVELYRLWKNSGVELQPGDLGRPVRN